MKALGWSSVLLCSLMLFQPLPAFGDNTTSGTPAPIMIGGTPVETFFTNARTDSWYVTDVVAGRSYCVETQSGVHFNAASDLGDDLFDTIVSVFHSNLVLIVDNDDTATEPFGFFASRACFIAPLSETILINVTPFNAGFVSFNARLRIVDTTLFCNWWFIGSGYNAFVILQNTTNSTVTPTITLRDVAGVQRGQLSPAIAGNGTVFPNASSFVTGGAIFGSIQIAHNASPGALVGTTNTQSATTGLSFDGACASRPTW